MSKLSHHPELVMSLKIGISKYQSFDFNRFRYIGVPRKRKWIRQSSLTVTSWFTNG